MGPTLAERLSQLLVEWARTRSQDVFLGIGTPVLMLYGGATDGYASAKAVRTGMEANAGIEVHREYSVERKGKWVLLQSPMTLRAGELVRVDLYLSLPAARNFVVVDDPVPGGLEPVNRDLATASDVDADKGEFQAAGGSFWFRHDDWLDYVPCPPEVSMRYALAILDRLGGNVDGLPEVAGGSCSDCDRTTLTRWQVGRFACCRACAARRKAVRG